MSDAHSDEGKAPGTYKQFTAIFVKLCRLLPVFFLAVEQFRCEILCTYTIVHHIFWRENVRQKQTERI
jgi:hypothetical protein